MRSTRSKSVAQNAPSESEEDGLTVYQKHQAKSKTIKSIAKKTAKKKETLNEQRVNALKDLEKTQSQINKNTLVTLNQGLSQPTTSAASLLAPSNPATSLSLSTLKLSSFAARTLKQMLEQAREKIFSEKEFIATLRIYILQIQ